MTTTPTAKPVKAVRLTFNEKHALDLLFPEKGNDARIERLFSAVAPLLSTWLITGGNKTDFEVSGKARHGALVSRLWAAHAAGKGTAKKIGDAWAVMSARALTFKGKSCEFSQAQHDDTIEAMSVEFSALFPTPAEKKVSDKETPKQVIDRLTAELATLQAERDAIKAERDAIKAERDAIANRLLVLTSESAATKAVREVANA